MLVVVLVVSMLLRGQTICNKVSLRRQCDCWYARFLKCGKSLTLPHQPAGFKQAISRSSALTWALYDPNLLQQNTTGWIWTVCHCTWGTSPSNWASGALLKCILICGLWQTGRDSLTASWFFWWLICDPCFNSLPIKNPGTIQGSDAGEGKMF